MYKEHILLAKILNKRANNKQGKLSAISYFILMTEKKKVNLKTNVR